MKIGVLGTGMVGETIASKLVSLGHDVMMGSRTADNPKARAWVEAAGAGASAGTFRDAALHGKAVWNCTSGAAALDALALAGADAIEGKILVDLSNPLDFSKGMPPQLFVFNDDSLGERIQRAYPGAMVVKTLNTVNCQVMVDPHRIPGESSIFVSGDDPSAKAEVSAWLKAWFGWKDVVDLGGIATARGTEAYLPLWIRLWSSLGSADFNVKVVR